MLSTILKFVSGDVLDTVAGLFSDYQDNKITKEELRFKLETFEASNEQDLKLAQIEVNKAAAKSDSLFVAGARPFILWVCGLGFAMNFLIAPIGTFCANIAGYPEIVFPQADLSVMLPVLMGLLGIGGLRTYEKVKGVAREKL
jgi:hypothetical protein